MNSSLIQKKLDVVQDISKALSASLDLETLLSLIVTKVTELMSASRATLFLLSDDKNHLWSKVLKGDELVEIRLKVGQGLAGWVAANGQSVNIADAYQDKRFDGAVDKESGFKTETILCVPMLQSSGGTVGVLQLLNKKGGPFNEEDEELLMALSSQAAMAIENSKLYHSVVANNKELATAKEHLKKRNEELDLLYRLERSLGTNQSKVELYQRLVSVVKNELGASHCFVGRFIDKRKNDIECFTGVVGQKNVTLHLAEKSPFKKCLMGTKTTRMEGLDIMLPANAFQTLHPLEVKNALVAPLDCKETHKSCLLYTSPSPRDATLSRMPSSA